MSIVEYDGAAVAEIATYLDMRKPNAAALDKIAQALNEREPGAEIVADLATGVGKTYIAGGLLDYLYEQGVRNVVIITPGSTIQRKTIANLTPGNRKYLQGLKCEPEVITLDDLERGAVAQALDNPDQMKVVVLTVQSLLRPNTKDNRRAYLEHETLSISLSDYLKGVDDLVVIAEAAHVGGEGAGIGAAADICVGEREALAEGGGDHRAEVGVELGAGAGHHAHVRGEVGDRADVDAADDGAAAGPVGEEGGDVGALGGGEDLDAAGEWQDFADG